ncbi:MAG TPA: glycosyltransferase family 39 protein [Vicinamibacteria bacterium]|nr:glycosyltransferase family 39 protein [Vicinamibacteria bacterium]
MDAARTMAEGGDWLVPRYEGRPFFDKPILSYWLMAVGMKALGPTPAAARVVAVASALALVLATAWLGALVFDRRTGLLAAVVLASTVGFLSFARIAMSDMLLAVWTTLAVALLVRAFQPSPPWWPLPAVAAVLGLGLATKGPIALLVPGLALLPLLAQERRLPRPRPWALALSALAFVVLGLGWFLLLYRRLGWEPLSYFFLRENLERFAGEAYDVGRPPWFYLPAYLAEGLPWSAFLPLALLRLRSAPEPERRSSWRLALWSALVLVPLSLSRGKIDYYLLPVYPALSVLVGRYFAVVPWGRLDRAWARLVLSLAAGAAVWIAVRPPTLPPRWLPGHAVWVAADALLLLAAAVLAAVALRPAASRVLAALAGVTAALALLVTAFFLPAFAGAQPNRAIAADVARERSFVPSARLAYCDDPSHARRDVLFEARHAGLEQCDLWGLASAREKYLLLLSPAQDASLRALPKYRSVASYRFLPAGTLTLGGLVSRATPGTVVLGANFATSDPTAEVRRRREYRHGVQADLEAEARRRGRPAVRDGTGGLDVGSGGQSPPEQGRPGQPGPDRP